MYRNNVWIVWFLCVQLQHFKRQERLIPERTVWKYFIQICSALDHMHSRRIMHRGMQAVFYQTVFNVQFEMYVFFLSPNHANLKKSPCPPRIIGLFRIYLSLQVCYLSSAKFERLIMVVVCDVCCRYQASKRLHHCRRNRETGRSWTGAVLQFKNHSRTFSRLDRDCFSSYQLARLQHVLHGFLFLKTTVCTFCTMHMI